MVGFARRNFLVPLPQVRDFEELNHLLAQRCEQYGTHQIGGRRIPARWTNASKQNAPPYWLYPIDPSRTSSRSGSRWIPIRPPEWTTTDTRCLERTSAAGCGPT